MNFLDWLGAFLMSPARLKQSEERVEQLEHELEAFQKQISYGFTPPNWILISGDVCTKKIQQNGIDLELDIRDLLNSTIYSRNLALDVIKTVKRECFWKNSDELFNHLALTTANLIIPLIKYKTNQEQFKVTDRWGNGDTSLKTGYGDCDLSSRAFIRILNDALDRLKMFEYMKYVFLAVGFYGSVGHAWSIIFDPVYKCFKVVECTRDLKYQKLYNLTSKYSLYFVHNFKYIWYQHKDWRFFL